MNKLPVYLYSNLLEVILDLDQNKGIHEIMYQRKIKIQKGFKDSIQIQFKNSDQKPISVATTGNYWFDMIDSTGRQLVLTKPLTILDDSIVYPIAIDQTATGNTLSFTDTSAISIGQSVYGFGIPANTIVTEITTNTVILNYSTIYPITTASDVTLSTLSTRGIATIEFSPAETINLVAGNYKFLIKNANNDGSFTPAYSNTYYGITGDIEIVEDGFPIGFPVQKVSREQLIAGLEYDRDPNNMGYFFTSGWLRPFPSAMTTSTPQCATFSLNNFAGTITVEGTLDNIMSPAGQANAQAFAITTATISSVTQGNIQLAWNNAATGIRFVIMPNPGSLGINYYPSGNPIGSNLNKFPNGFVDFIQYFS